jgi:hypothetical protein
LTNTLLRFDTTTPGTIQATIAVTGLTGGDVLVGTDFRPSNGLLYGVGVNDAANTLRMYTIDLTGATTPVSGPITPTGSTITGATFWGVDFNPTSDRIRVVNNLASDGAGGNANNIRLNALTGTLQAVDPDLNFTGLPGGAANGPEVAVAHTNSQFGTRTGGTTTLFGIVSGGDRLVINGGAMPTLVTLTDVGLLGVNTSDLAGLDIFGPNNGVNSTAFAVLTTAAVPSLYSINLTTGAATLVGAIAAGNAQLTDISIAPDSAPVVASGTLDGRVQLLTPVGGQLVAGATVTAVANSTANVRSGTADVNNDGTPDLVLVTGPGTPVRVAVLSGLDNTTVLVAPFDPFGDPNFTGGGFIATGDFNNDGRDDFVVTPDQGGGPRVSIFSRNADGTTTVLANFLGIDDANFRGGARAAAGDVNNDGRPELVVGAGFLGGPRVAIFNGTTLTTTPTRLINDFFAFPGTDATTLRNGVFVAVSDVNGDGFEDLAFGGGPGGAPRVFVLSGALVTANNDVGGAQAAPVANFFVAGNSTDRGGVRLAAADLDGDTRGDLVVGSGEGVAAMVRAYRGLNFTDAAEPTVFQDLDLFSGAVLSNGVFVG